MKLQFHLPLATYPDACSSAVIDNAIELCRQNDADLIASIVQVKIPPVSQPFPTAIDLASWRAEAERFSRARGVEQRHYLERSVREVRYRLFDINSAEPNVCESFAEVARAHDLSIVQASQEFRPLAEALLFGSGRPVLLTPASKICGRIETVAIAWDGSRPAARSVCAARQFLEKATKIKVVYVTDDKQLDPRPRELLISSLRNAGIEVDEIPISTTGETVAAAIQSTALTQNADLLVAGGFGHTRFREMILGGVTRELLSQVQLPVLLAH